MTTFDDREKGFESKFALDQEQEFKAIARRNKLLGLWAAKQMNLSQAEAEAYAMDVVRADFEEAGDEDVIRKLLGDFTGAGVDVGDAEIREQLEFKTAEARHQLIDQQG